MSSPRQVKPGDVVKAKADERRRTTPPYIEGDAVSLLLQTLSTLIHPDE
jgi:hypothetical protein